MSVSPRNQHLREKSKKLHELVHEEYFRVQSIVRNNYVTHGSQNVRYGGPNPAPNETGYQTELAIKVAPKGASPLKELEFKGNAGVRPGDLIYAKIPAYKEELESQEEEGNRFNPAEEPASHYIARPYEKKEEAIEISVLSEDGKEALDTSYSVNSSFYTEDK